MLAAWRILSEMHILGKIKYVSAILILGPIVKHLRHLWNFSKTSLKCPDWMDIMESVLRLIYGWIDEIHQENTFCLGGNKKCILL